jgi:hypothetical protein
MVSAAVACLPTAVILLLLEALFMQISGVSLALTWPCKLCLLRILLCVSLCYKLSPFQAHWERWHCTHFLSPACLFTVHVGSGPSPLSCAVFLPPPLLQAFLLLITGQCCCSCQPPCLFTAYVGSGSFLLSCGVFLPLPLSQAFPLLVAGCAPCCHRSLSCLPNLFIYSSGKDSLPPIFGTQCAPPSFPRVFIVLIAYYSVSLFSLGGGQSVQGDMLLWPRLVCGSTAVLWSSPCPCLPKPSGHRRLAAWGPSLFLHLMWSGDSLHRLEVWRVQSFASSQWFCLQSVSPVSLQDFTIGGSLSASSL